MQPSGWKSRWQTLTCSSTLEDYSLARCPFPVATLLPLTRGLERLPQLRTLYLDDLPAMADPTCGDHRMDHWRFLISATAADERDASPALELDLDLPDELSGPRFHFLSARDVAAIEAAQDEVLGALVELCRSHDEDPALDVERAPLTLSLAGWHNLSSSGWLVAALLQSLTDVQGVCEEFGMPLPVELHSPEPDAHERSRLVALKLSRVRVSVIEKQQLLCRQAECSESRPRPRCPTSLGLVIVLIAGSVDSSSTTMTHQLQARIS